MLANEIEFGGMAYKNLGRVVRPKRWCSSFYVSKFVKILGIFYDGLNMPYWLVTKCKVLYNMSNLKFQDNLASKNGTITFKWLNFAQILSEFCFLDVDIESTYHLKKLDHEITRHFESCKTIEGDSMPWGGLYITEDRGVLL